MAAHRPGPSLSRAARLAAPALPAVAGLLGLATTALAFDKVDHLQPVPAGRGYVYFIRETDALKAPLTGRPVSIAVGKVPGPDATVAPADAGGHAVGPAGATATQQSGEDGRVYFLLRTSATPGENEFTWKDPRYAGQVLVTGVGPSPTATAAGAAPVRGATTATPGSARAAPHSSFSPVVAGALATVLAWVVAGVLLMRRQRRLSALADAAAEQLLAARLPT